MDLLQNIQALQTRVNTLVKSFNTLIQARSTPKPEDPLPDRAEGARRLNAHMRENTRLTYAEADEFANATALSNEQVSLLLRYRPAIYGDDAKAASSMIFGSLKEGDMAGQMGANLLQAALRDDLDKANPVAATRHIGSAARLAAAQAEQARLQDGIRRSPLTPDEARNFHAFYTVPEDPKGYYQDTLEKKAETYIRLTETTLAHVEHTMSFVGTIDSVIKPVFPELAAGFEEHALKLLLEAGKLLQTAPGYLGLAYRHAPVRGPTQ